MQTPLLGSDATTKASAAVKRSRSLGAGLASEGGAGSSSSSIDALGGSSQQPRGTMGNGRGYRPVGDVSSLWQRYRGVAAIAAVPVLLILTVLALMPRAAPSGGGGLGGGSAAAEFSRSQPFSRTGFEKNSGGNVAERWSIVIDAGSTGSRIHIFKFLEAGGQLELQFDKFDQLKPGLSSFADAPPKAAESLKPLLDLAVATVPKKLQASTHVMVGATAGLRLLPDGKADIILEEVRKYLRASYPFPFANDDVKILSGSDEGAFAWLTLNYLLGRLGRSEDETVAAIDLGGGSVQEAFAMTKEEASKAPRPDYTTTLKGGGKAYSVYVYSYLGYGLMAARAAVLSEAKSEHPCVPKGYSGEYKYAGVTHPVAGSAAGPSPDKCAATVLTALKHQADCGAPQLQCTFNGAWGGSHVPTVFYISSYFWDRAIEAGIIKDTASIEQKVTSKEFKALAAKACTTPLEDYKSAFPAVQEDLHPYFCLDLSYAHTLLTKGFKIPEEREVTLVKKVKYKNDHIEVAWALGAGIQMLAA